MAKNTQTSTSSHTHNDLAKSNTKELLIRAGLEEIDEFGFANFSTRRVAKRCNVSCAAPYKHFKDTNDFIAQVLGYVNELYISEQSKLLEEIKDADSRTQLIQVSMHYVRFLVKYPEFRRVIMQNYKDCDSSFQCLRGELSTGTYKIVSRYCADVNMSDEDRKRKTFVIRSLIYGAALFFDNAEMEYSDENLRMVESLIERELDKMVPIK